MLVNVMRLVCRRQHFTLVDVIHTELLENLGLGEMADAALRHHRNGNGSHDFANLFRRSHTRNPAFGADLRGHALERHDGDSSGVLGDDRLLRIRHVHNYAAFEHFGEAGL